MKFMVFIIVVDCFWVYVWFDLCGFVVGIFLVGFVCVDLFELYWYSMVVGGVVCVEFVLSLLGFEV